MPVTTPILVEQFLFGIKQESSYASIASLSATDYMYVSKCDVKIDSKDIERNYKQGALLSLASAQGDTLVNISVEGEYLVSGSTGGNTASPMNAIEESCGLTKFTVAGVQSTYVADSTASANFPCPGKSATVAAYYNNELILVKGVYGTLTETHASDGLVRFKYDAKGLWYSGSNQTVSAIASATFLTESYVRVTSASLNVHAYDPEWSTFEVMYGNDVQAIPYAGDQYGYSKVMIVNRKPTFTFNPLMVNKTSGHDFIGRMVDKSTGAVRYYCGTGTARRMEYIASQSQYTAVDIQERQGLQGYNVTGKIVGAFTKKIY